MSTFKVTVEKIEVVPHPGADKLELVRVGDYSSIVSKDSFKTGDLVAYIPEASIVPLWLQKELGVDGRLAGPKHDRVKAVRLRGVLSQGLVYPARDYWNVGDDVTEELQIKKWEPPVPACLAGEVCVGGSNRTISYDIENYKRFPELMPDGTEVVFTEKLHGCLHASSQVTLADKSQMTIAEIVDSKLQMEVLSYEEMLKTYIVRKITGKMRRPNLEKKPWVKLTFGDKQLTLTIDHPIYSRSRNRWIYAGDIFLGEDIESPFE